MLRLEIMFETCMVHGALKALSSFQSEHARTHTLKKQMEREDVYLLESLWLQGLGLIECVWSCLRESPRQGCGRAVRASTGRGWGLERTSWTSLNWDSLGWIYGELCTTHFRIITSVPFWGDSTDLLENSFFVDITKMKPYVLYGWVLYPIYFIVAWGYFVSSGGE